MTTHFFSGLAGIFGKRRCDYRRDLESYAKTEYKHDWRFAYDYMVANEGRGPSAYALHQELIKGAEMARLEMDIKRRQH